MDAELNVPLTATLFYRAITLLFCGICVRRVFLIESVMNTRTNKKVSFVYQTKETFLRDAFLAERDAHCVRDADFVCDARLRRV